MAFSISNKVCFWKTFILIYIFYIETESILILYDKDNRKAVAIYYLKLVILLNQSFYSHLINIKTEREFKNVKSKDSNKKQKKD